MTLPIATPPETPVRCPGCGWTGTAGECKNVPADALRCPNVPGCGREVVPREPEPAVAPPG